MRNLLELASRNRAGRARDGRRLPAPFARLVALALALVLAAAPLAGCTDDVGFGSYGSAGSAPAVSAWSPGSSDASSATAVEEPAGESAEAADPAADTEPSVFQLD